MQVIWDFIQNQILGMKWLYELIGLLLGKCGLDISGRIGGSIQFFIFDIIKIMVLLGVLILIISYIQSYFPPERTKKILGRFHGIGANCIAALLGTVTPFCSCSSIPLFIGFTSAGLPLGVTFSFLISSPMVDLGSLVLLMSIFGWKVAVIYVIVGLIIAVVGGTLIEKLHLENQVEEFIRKGKNIDIPQDELHFKDRIKYAWEQVLSTAKKVFPYVLIGVGIGAVIHNWIPEEFIVKLLGDNNPFGVIIATIAGVPMYADIFGTIPIAEALLSKGALLGVVLSFMIRWLTTSAEQGNQYAQYALGKLYFYDGDVPCDKEKSLYWLELSAAQGNIYAQYLIDNIGSYRNPSVLLAATRLMHRLENLFREDYRRTAGIAAGHIDRKRRRKLQEKKQAQGHKRDDHAPQIHL